MFRGPKRWVDFVPTQGGEKNDEPYLILRDIPNPYTHQRVNVVKLNYYPIDDDQYGVSELESIRSMLKALWALLCNYIDAINLDLFPIVKGHPTNVNWNTVDYHARAVWLMNNPQTDLVRLESGNASVQKFDEVYKLLISAMAEALGESTADASTANPLAGNKTATEISDTALIRSARDNFNKLALAAAMAKMVWFWWQMDKQLLTADKVIRVDGKDALQYFIKEGLDGYDLSEEGFEKIETYMEEHMGVPFDQAYEALRELGELDQYAKPLHGTGPQGGLPKLTLDRSGKSGFLRIDPEKDLAGSMHYIPDVEAMSLPNDQQDATNLLSVFSQLTQPQILQTLAATGDTPRLKDLMVKIMSKLKINDGEQYFGGGEGMAEAPLSPEQQAPQGQLGIPPPAGQPIPQGPAGLPTPSLQGAPPVPLG
jgi:hypothetical protein